MYILTILSKGSRVIALEENCPPDPRTKTNSKPNLNHGEGWGDGEDNCPDTLSENSFSNKFFDRRCTY